MKAARAKAARKLRSAHVLLVVGIAILTTLPACRDEDTAKTLAPKAEPTTAQRRAPSESTRRRPGPPNVLLITLDTTRADALGAYGQARPTSPAIDRLARTGIVFDSALTASPETLPSHATILTGKYPFDHGVRSNVGHRLDKGNETLAERLRAHGYRTGAEVASSVLQKATQIDQGFESFRGAESEGVELQKRGVKGDSGEEETSYVRTGSDITRQGLDFLRAHRSEPFFLWLHYFDPHSPYLAPLEYQAKIPDSAYHAEVASVDAQVGRIIHELEHLGIADDTLVVLTADHGEGLYEHDEPTHAFLVYDTTMRVPLILWGWKGLPGARKVDSVVRTADVLPTILDLLDLPTPDGLRGDSLGPLLSGETTDSERSAYGEATSFVRTFGVPPIRFLREGRWKYIHKANPELYDVMADPSETENLAERKPEIVARLRKQLVALVAEARPAATDSVSVDDATARQLQALGYVASPSTSIAAIRDDDDSLAIDGADPNQLMDDVLTVSIADGMLAAGRFDDAITKLEELRAREADNDFVQSIIHRSLVGAGRYDEALPVLASALGRSPLNIELRESYAAALSEVGRLPEAIEVLEGGLVHSPCTMKLHSNLDTLLRREKRHVDLVAILESAVSDCPDDADLLNNFAWALATLPDAEIRDGARAERLIRRAIELSGREGASHLDTLAAAVAEQGRYTEAADLQRRAIAALEGAGYPKEAEAAVHDHLATYLAGRPVLDPAPGS
jgi:arylsulfatase A-like enzyme